MLAKLLPRIPQSLVVNTMPDLHVRPYSTAELNKLGAIKVDSNTPIRLYFRSADLLLKQARVYRNEGDLQEAYRLYMKYSKYV